MPSESGNGVAVDDGATGTGYLMFSAETVHTRFSGNAPNPQHQNHLIAVRFDNGQWQYNNNINWYAFVPNEMDRLIANLDFDNDSIASLQGINGEFNGIGLGYDEGDLVFYANQWNGVANSGEFQVSGTYVQFCSEVSSGEVNLVGSLGLGIAAHDDAVGTGFILYSEESVHTRFASNPPISPNSAHLIAVRFFNNQWQYSNNADWFDFTVSSNDRLLASVNFSTDKITSLQGTSGVFEGIDNGFANGGLEFIANRWNGAELAKIGPCDGHMTNADAYDREDFEEVVYVNRAML